MLLLRVLSAPSLKLSFPCRLSFDEEVKNLPRNQKIVPNLLHTDYKRERNEKMGPLLEKENKTRL
jgi:hypothetical protein